MMGLALVSMLMVVGVAAGDAAAPVVVLAEGGVHACARWSLDADGRLMVTPEDAAEGTEPVAVEGAAVLDVRGGANERGGQAGGTGGVVVTLRQGEVLRGKLVASDTVGTLRVDLGELGTQRLGLDHVARVRFVDRTVAGGGAAAEDVGLRMTNGDLVTGKVGAVGPEQVTIDSEFGPVETSTSRLAEVVLSAEPVPADGREAGALMIELVDGQRWHVSDLKRGASGDTIQVTRDRAVLTLAVSRVRRIVFAGWSVADLVGASAVTVTTTPYLNESVRVTVDKASEPRPLAIGKRSFVGGITAEPRSRVAFTLREPGAYLLGWVGMDPLRGATGSCDVAVESSGGAGVRFEELTAKEGAQAILVPLKGGREVALVTDFGEGAELGDCVNFCGLMVVRKGGVGDGK